MAQRSVRKMLNKQAKLTGRTALGTKKPAIRGKAGGVLAAGRARAKATGRTAGKAGAATNGLKTTPKRRILPGVVQKSPLRSTPARKILPGVVQKPKNKQRSVASMRATQRRLRKG